MVKQSVILLGLTAVWMCQAMPEMRSSEPINIMEPSIDAQNQVEWDQIFLDHIPGPEILAILDKDTRGEPLNPTDFAAAVTLKHPVIELTSKADPIELASLFEGDIRIESSQAVQDMIVGRSMNSIEAVSRNAMIDLNKRWPNGVIPYVISASYDNIERATIAMAMKNYQEKTCIRFVPRSVERDYIHIIKSDGCSSSVGRVGGAQAVSLGPGCLYVGIVMHEFMHAAGFWHEQSRSDRDNFITINKLNIQNGMEYNFNKYNWNTIQSLGVSYDLGSIMHYGPYAFAKNRKLPTIIARKPGTEMGQRRAFSIKDIEKLQKLYNCATTTNVAETSTEAPSVTVAPIGDKCADSDKHCSTWSSAGECEKNPTWMHSNCKKSCKQCEKECPDNSEHCVYWAQGGECRNNAAYMSLYCKKSCGQCHAPSEYQNACVELNEHCDHWAKDRQCISNPGYMLTNCQKSCKVC